MTKDDFDIRTGMTVYGASGDKVGTITTVAGFGATRIHGVSEQQADGLATQASSGTGYIRIDRTDILGPGTDDLVIPFNRINGVQQGYGVTLRDEVAPPVAPQSTRSQPAPAESKKKSWWQRRGSDKNE